jgi:hypothetical protein
VLVQQEPQGRDFSQPLEANFVVALKAKNGEFCLFVESFFRRKGKDYMQHTSDIARAKRFAKLTAEDVVERLMEFRCTGRVERVSPDNSRHVPV